MICTAPELLELNNGTSVERRIGGTYICTPFACKVLCKCLIKRKYVINCQVNVVIDFGFYRKTILYE